MHGRRTFPASPVASSKSEQRTSLWPMDAQAAAVDPGLPGEELQRGRGLLLERADADVGNPVLGCRGPTPVWPLPSLS